MNISQYIYNIRQKLPLHLQIIDWNWDGRFYKSIRLHIFNIKTGHVYAPVAAMAMWKAKQ